jgi:glucokinase
MSIVGVDLGVDRVTAVTVDEAGTVMARASEPMRPGELALVARAAYQAARLPDATTTRLGVTIPFQDNDLPATVQRVLSEDANTTPVAVNVGQAVALAEAWCGAARGVANVISFAIGDHVTAGILIDGRLLHGASGHAGSVAWLALNPVEREDYRRLGGLEAEVAAGGIVKRLVWRIKSGDRSRVVERVGGDLSRLTADDVFAAARDGDGVCVSVIRDTAKYVGMAIANVATVVDPECVVLGGTLAISGDLMLEAIRTECSRRLRPTQVDHVRIVLATLGDDAPAIGAARAALMQQA